MQTVAVYSNDLYEIPYLAAIFLAISTLMFRLPRSYSESLVCVTPIAAAISFWVRPSLVRRPSNALPGWKSGNTSANEYVRLSSGSGFIFINETEMPSCSNNLAMESAARVTSLSGTSILSSAYPARLCVWVLSIIIFSLFSRGKPLTVCSHKLFFRESGPAEQEFSPVLQRLPIWLHT